MAPKPKELSEKTIFSLAQVGCTEEEIALHLGCSVDTIQRRYAAVLKKGRAELRMSLRRSQVKKALEGDNTMLIWLGKIILGQKEEKNYDPIDYKEILGNVARALEGRVKNEQSTP